MSAMIRMPPTISQRLRQVNSSRPDKERAMELSPWRGDLATMETAALLVGAFEDGTGQGWQAVDELTGGRLSAFRQLEEFSGKPGQLLMITGQPPMAAARILLVGLGKRRSLDGRRIREATGQAVRHLTGLGLGRFAVLTHWEGTGGRFVRPAAEGALLGGYVFSRYKTGKEVRRCAEAASFPCRTPGEERRLANVLAEVGIEGAAVWRARDLVTLPGNVATPAWLTARAVEEAAERGIACRVLGSAELAAQQMNGILAVAAGSRQEPAFIVLEYRGAPAGVRPVVLVGKGITFDSGGISLKPREGMERMKSDMAGAAAVMETVMAAAELGLAVNVVGLVPVAENMPDGGAYKPGDVITTMAGKTVEIVNTDAEGRLLLGDALHYARRYRPAWLVDVGTLTGACLVALGFEATGLMSRDDELANRLHEAGEATGERVWRLPLWDEYGSHMESDIAALKNAGGPTAGTVTAGWYLGQFAAGMRWAHLDIAGTAWEEKGRNHLPKGATGVGVRLLLEFLRRL
jgi:leucyl aminopeptidase